MEYPMLKINPILIMVMIMMVMIVIKMMMMMIITVTKIIILVYSFNLLKLMVSFKMMTKLRNNSKLHWLTGT